MKSLTLQAWGRWWHFHSAAVLESTGAPSTYHIPPYLRLRFSLSVLSLCLSVSPSTPHHLHPYAHLLPISHSSHLAFLLATIMVFSQACNSSWLSEAIVNLLPFSSLEEKKIVFSPFFSRFHFFFPPHVVLILTCGCFPMLSIPLFWVFAVQQENERPSQRGRDRMGLN